MTTLPYSKVATAKGIKEDGAKSNVDTSATIVVPTAKSKHESVSDANEEQSHIINPITKQQGGRKDNKDDGQTFAHSSLTFVDKIFIEIECKHAAVTAKDPKAQ